MVVPTRSTTTTLGLSNSHGRGNAAECRGAAHERAAQRMDGEVDNELGPHRTRVREHDHEQPDRPLAAGDRNLADVRPVHLCLLAWQGLDHQIRLALRPRTNERDVFAQGPHRASITALTDHVVEPGREERGIAAELIVDEWAVRLEDSRPQL